MFAFPRPRWPWLNSFSWSVRVETWTAWGLRLAFVGVALSGPTAAAQTLREVRPEPPVSPPGEFPLPLPPDEARPGLRFSSDDQPGQAPLPPPVPSSDNSARASSTGPNIVLIVSDDQRFDTLGCLGHPAVTTPHIDALAARGTIFHQAFCTTSICSTSRATILSGQYARRHGIIDFAATFPDRAWQETFPARLRAAGYFTGFVGKWGIGPGGKMPRDQYDVWFGYPGQGNYYPPAVHKPQDPRPVNPGAISGEHLTDTLTAEAVTFLDRVPAGKPFCLQVSHKAAHCQDGTGWQFPIQARYADVFADRMVPVPPTATPVDFGRLPRSLQVSEGRVRWTRRFATPELTQQTTKDYYRLLMGLDESVGTLVNELTRRGLIDNTVIIYTSDNGYYLGDYGLAGKWFAHDVSTRIPMVVFDGRAPRQATAHRREMVLTTDLAPTILDLAGLAPPSSMQGVTLTPLLNGADGSDDRAGEAIRSWRTEMFYEHLLPHEKIPPSESVRTQDWKYVRYRSGDAWEEQLFDLRADPLERKNLAGETGHAQTLGDLRRRCDAYVRSSGPIASSPVPERLSPERSGSNRPASTPTISGNAP